MEIISVDVLKVASPYFVFIIVVELIFSKFKGNKSLYKLRDFVASGFIGVSGAMFGMLLKIAMTMTIFYFVYHLFNPEINGVRTNIFGYEALGWAWYIWLICQLLDDLSFYWFHRLSHTIRLLWAAHIMHHSSEHFNFGTGIRNGWFTTIYKPLFYMWIPMLGFHPEMVLICMGIETFWQFHLHSQYWKKWGILEKFLNTPKQHQVHHAKNFEYLDKNHGGILNLFDQLFGTWKEFDDDLEVEYGVVHSPNSYNPIIIATHEYKSILDDLKKSKNLYQALMYVFGPPGWSPNGETLTVKQMRLNLKNK